MSRFHRLLMSVAVLAAAASSSSSAQMVPGGRIRVGGDMLGNRPVVAILIAASHDSLRFRTLERQSFEQRADTLSLPRSALKRLEVPNGTYRETKQGAWWGFVGGMLVGGVVGYATYDRPPACSGFQTLCFNVDEHGEAAVAGALGGGILGVVAGAVLGHYVISDRWIPAEGTTSPRVSILPRRDGVALQLSLSVR